MSKHTIPSKLNHILQCPNCAKALETLICKNCSTEFFSLNNTLCLMPLGMEQRTLWERQIADMSAAAQSSQDYMQSILDRPDVIEESKVRVKHAMETAQQSHRCVVSLLSEIGLEAKQFDYPAHTSAMNSISEYYHHILQDWAWDQHVILQKLERITDSLQKTTKFKTPLQEMDRNIVQLVLGAGAGRLSWELHKLFEDAITLATDINPLLLAVAEKLIKRQEAFIFFELNSFPQIGCPESQHYTLNPAEGSRQQRDTWFSIAADVWHMPIQQQSLDRVVTCWFMDVHGGDNRRLIELVQKWLKPGGIWINHGPLLYPRAFPFEQKYGREELVSLMELAGFDVQNEHVSKEKHLDSPINIRTQHEQVWTFAAIKSATQLSETKLPPDWLVFHDRPIPTGFPKSDEQHALVRQILSAVDGKTSINQLCVALAHAFPKGMDVRDGLVTLFGELMESDGLENADDGQ